MLMIDKNQKNEIVINKSRFINYLFIINKLDDVEKYLNEIKEEYKDATHYCYAYIFDNVKRFNDDGEPGGTAGVPMLNVLESHNLNHVLTITIRYFGGIKLGAGGLVRAYTKSVTENLKDLGISEYIDGYNFDISFPYELKDLFESKLKEFIQSKSYSDFINYNISLKEENFDGVKSLLDSYNINIKNLTKIKIKKSDN
jgi:uncharacterized YigZ family protein